MKKPSLILTFFLIVTVASVNAQIKPDKGTVKLRGTRLTYPLVNKWIAEFNKEYPGIKVQITPDAPKDSIDFSIASYKLTKDDLPENREGISLTRYVQLPVANSKRPGLQELQAKGFKEEDFRKLYFTKSPATLGKIPATVYTRDKPACATKTFATHYGAVYKDINGIPVKGDDQDLANAVKKDVNALSYNNLGFIYDLKTRKIQDGLAIIPIDVNENGKVDENEKIYSTLDKVISYLEKTDNSKFIIESVNVIFDKDSKNKAAGTFVNWVLNKGQKFNHEYGFLNLKDAQKTADKVKVSSSFKTASASSCDGANDVLRARRSKLAAK
jgi:phosphate transport system substrate-binding protein